MNFQLIESINRLKREKNAIILAHHYQTEEIKAVADYIGDSLELARIATNCEEETLILCGVYFMAETAKILSPSKRVILPNMDAGCPMADMITAERLIEEKKKHPNAKVVCYVNSSAEVKAESDICCTSSNAVEIVKNLNADEILFVPDQNLGHYVSLFAREKKVILWRGFCPTHHRIEVADLETVVKANPTAEVLVHPECKPEIVERADFVGSTSQIIKYAKESTNKTLIIGTEDGVMDTLKKNSPEKTFISLHPCFTCPNMKKTTLENVLNVLETGENEIFLDEDIRIRSFKAIDDMLTASK